jgi:hypothetical protein
MASEAFNCGRQQIYLHSIMCWKKDQVETTTVRHDNDAIKLNLWWVYLIMRHTQQISTRNLRCNYSSPINIQEALSYWRCHCCHQFEGLMHGLSRKGAPSIYHLLSPLKVDVVQCVPTFGYWVLRVVLATLKKIYSFANGISQCIWWEAVMKFSKGYGLLHLIKCSLVFICNGIWFALPLEIKPGIYKESARR